MMINIDEKYIIAIGVVLEEINPSYFNKEDIQENIYEEIEELRLKKLISIIKESVEETEGTLEINEERKITLEVIKDFSEEEFEEFKTDLQLTIQTIKAGISE